LIKPINFFKKPTGSIRFYKSETELNRTQTEKNRANRFEPVFVQKNRTETSRFEPVSVFFFFKISVWLLFFDKNRTEPKIITLTRVAGLVG
jgi:hypothetical protein